ncbi:MAG: hypothetical protein GY757_18910 [bacterium]|nr:hypothetical protein [bacterium]
MIEITSDGMPTNTEIMVDGVKIPYVTGIDIRVRPGEFITGIFKVHPTFHIHIHDDGVEWKVEDVSVIPKALLDNVAALKVIRQFIDDKIEVLGASGGNKGT